MSRRSIMAALILFLAGLYSMTPGFSAEPIEVGKRACLFLDDRFIAEQSGLKRSWHQGQPADKPAITADAATGDDWPHLFGSVFYDPYDKLYKMFYEAVQHGKGWIRYAESTDGKKWTRPRLGLVELNGSRENNVVFAPAELPNVFIQPDANDPQGRIKMIAWCRQQNFKGQEVSGLYLFQSPDGKDWRPVGHVKYTAPNDDTAQARVVLDTNQIIWDGLGKRFYGSFRSFPTHPGLPGFVRDENNQTSFGVVGGHRRAVAISTSPEIQTGWPASQTVLRADAEDDKKAMRLSSDPARLDYCELYIMPIFAYGNHYIGMVSLLFNVDGSDTVDGAGDIQFTFSHDGLKWQRQPDRQTFVRPNSDGLVPCYAQCNEPLLIGDEMWIYYSEADSAHPKTGDTSQIRGAYWRRDGFASLATEGRGVLTTHSIVCGGERLLLNVKPTEEGSLRAAVLDQEAKPLEGYGVDDCQAITSDGVSQEVKWRGGTLAAFKGKSIRLRLELDRATLYSFRFESSAP